MSIENISAEATEIQFSNLRHDITLSRLKKKKFSKPAFKNQSLLKLFLLPNSSGTTFFFDICSEYKVLKEKKKKEIPKASHVATSNLTK